MTYNVHSMYPAWLVGATSGEAGWEDFRLAGREAGGCQAGRQASMRAKGAC